MIKLKDLKKIIPEWQKCKFNFVDSTIIDTIKKIKPKHGDYEIKEIYASPMATRLIIFIDGAYNDEQ